MDDKGVSVAVFKPRIVAEGIAEQVFIFSYDTSFFGNRLVADMTLDCNKGGEFFRSGDFGAGKGFENSLSGHFEFTGDCAHRDKFSLVGVDNGCFFFGCDSVDFHNSFFPLVEVYIITHGLSRDN